MAIFLLGGIDLLTQYIEGTELHWKTPITLMIFGAGLAYILFTFSVFDSKKKESSNSTSLGAENFGVAGSDGGYD